MVLHEYLECLRDRALTPAFHKKPYTVLPWARQEADCSLCDVWHYVITVCDHANEYCPIFPFPSQRLHWGFPDPSQATGTEDERLLVFRRVRDEMFLKIRAWLAEQSELQRS